MLNLKYQLISNFGEKMLRLLLIVLGLIILIFLVPIIFQRNLIYFPVKKKPNRSDFTAEDMEIIKLHPNKNLATESWYKPAQHNNPTILYFHGNGGHIGHRVHFIRFFLDKGYGVFLLEYRGYGGNSGKPSEQGLYEDARSAVKFLQLQNIEPTKLAFYGESLGTAVALKMATEFSACSVVLQAPFTNLKEVARLHYPFLPILPLLDTYNSLKIIQDVKIPLIFVHGEKDFIVPIHLSKKLYENANEPKTFHVIHDKGHNNISSSNIGDLIIEFIKNNC